MKLLLASIFQLYFDYQTNNWEENVDSLDR
jgi:hypothetical protein